MTFEKDNLFMGEPVHLICGGLWRWEETASPRGIPRRHRVHRNIIGGITFHTDRGLFVRLTNHLANSFLWPRMYPKHFSPFSRHVTAETRVIRNVTALFELLAVLHVVCQAACAYLISKLAIICLSRQIKARKVTDG